LRVFFIIFCTSCSAQDKELPYPNLKGEPKVVGPRIVDSGFPMPVAIFSDSTRTDIYYSGWTNYNDFYIAKPDNPNSPIIVHEKVKGIDITFDTAVTEVARKYGFDNFKIDLTQQSQFYLRYNLTIVHGLAKTKLNDKNATGIIQGQKLDDNSSEKLAYFESVNSNAQKAISNQSVEKGKINHQIIKMLSEQAQLDVIEFQWDMNNDILYGSGW